MKEKLGAYPYLYPTPIVLVGTQADGGQPNYTTVGDAAIMGIGTPLVVISLSTKSLARQNIDSSGRFSINVPSTDMLPKVDFCATHSGRNFSKEALFTTFYGDSPGLPLIEECPVNMECEVIHSFTEANRHIFVAKVTQTHVSSGHVHYDGVKRRVAGLTELDPIMYALDNRYYRIGGEIGSGYKEWTSIDEEVLKRE